MAHSLSVYPTRPRAEEERVGRLASSGRKADFFGGIIGIERLEQALIDELVAEQPIGELERWFFLNDAIASAYPFSRGRYLSGLLASDGFARSVGELVQQLKLGLVTAADLSRISGFSPRKERWIRSVFRRYDRSLKKYSLCDSADIRMELIKKINEIKEPPRFLARFEEIHFFDIYHFTPFRFELIYQIARRHKTVLHFPLPDDRRKAFAFVERDIQKFQSLEDRERNIELAFDDGHRTQDENLRIFSGSVFSEQPCENGKDIAQSVEIKRNSSRYREVEEVAGAILNNSRGDWSDFCVVFRNLEEYGLIVEDVFRRAGIPVYLRRGVPVSSNPYIRTLFTVFRAVDNGFDLDEVLKLAVSDYFDFLPDGVEAGDVENLLKEAGVISGPATGWRKRVGSVVAKKKVSREMRSALEKIVRLVGRLEKVGAARTAAETMKRFRSVMKFLPPKPLRQSDPFSTRDLYCRGRFDALIGEIDRILKKYGLAGNRFDQHDLRWLLVNSLGNIPSPDWADRNQVQILNVHELAGRRFPYLFICGLHDGEFPQSTRQGSILAEREKKEFNRLHAETVLREIPQRKRGRQVFGRVGESWEEESFLFYFASRSAARKLFLSYSSSDLDGSDLGRSSFLEDIHGNFPQLEEKASAPVALEKDYHEQIDGAAKEAKLLRDLFNRPADEAGALEDYYGYFAGKTGSGESFRLSCERSGIEKKRRRFYLEHDPEKRKKASNLFTGMTGESSQLSAFFEAAMKNGYSPTSLERYANCPFQYFMYKPMACEPPATSRPDLESREKGSLIHEILERYYSGKSGGRAKPKPASESERKNRILAAAETVFRAKEAEKMPRNDELWKITKKQIKKTLELFVAHESGELSARPFEVLFTEFGFGVKKGLPVRIEVNGRNIDFSGQIDRVDYLPNERMLRVIDYKYSANPSQFNRLLKEESFGEESFQMPVYMLAALHAVLDGKNMPEVNGAVAAYFTLRKGPKISKPQESFFSDANSAVALKRVSYTEFGKRVHEQITRMESGEFSVTPRDCSFCPFRRACRYREVRSPSKGE